MYNKVKRVIDFCISLIILPIVLLLLVIVGIAIKLEDRGPIFYMGERIGYHGKIFKMFKFRSMKVNAPDLRYADGSTTAFKCPDWRYGAYRSTSGQRFLLKRIYR